MPELPEVEITRRNLVRWLARRTLARVEADRTRVTRGGTAKKLAEVHGKLVAATRRGKFLMLGFESRLGLIVHLGMTGKFVKRKALAEERFSRARFLLDNGSVLHFTDPRMFGQIVAWPADSLLEFPSVSRLGVDPLVDGLTGETLAEAVSGSRQPLKVALMDQARIAGLGNIHAAEALFRAGIHPARAPKSLSAAEYERLAQTIHEAFAFGLDRAAAEEVQYLGDGSKLENPFLIYDRAGTACSQCGGEVTSIPQGGRTTHLCAVCQPLRKPRKRKTA